MGCEASHQNEEPKTNVELTLGDYELAGLLTGPTLSLYLLSCSSGLTFPGRVKAYKVKEEEKEVLAVGSRLLEQGWMRE